MADRMYWGGENDRTIAVSKDTPLPVAQYSAGRSPFVSTYGDANVTVRSPDILVQFQYNLSTRDVHNSVSGTGSVAQANHQGEAHSGTGIGTARLYSHAAVRYRPGFEVYGIFSARFTTPEANTTQLAGLFDEDHGYALGFNGTTFAITLRNNGSDDFTAAEWLDPLDGTGDSRFKLDATKLNIFKITYGWLGVSPIVFWVDTGYLGGWVPFAYIDLINTQTTPSVDNPNLRVQLESIRTAGTGADLIIASASWSAGSEVDPGFMGVGARPFSYRNEKAVSAGVLTNLFTIRSATTFQSIESHIRTDLTHLSGAMDGTKPGEILLYANATLGGTPAFTDIDATNSTMSVDVAGTTVTGGTFLMSFDMAKSGNFTEHLGNMGLHVHPGDDLTVAALSAGAADMSASLRWHELF